MLAPAEKRFAAVFISDLHLHPEEPAILARFNAFIDWAAKNTQAVYILGDFFHAWPGDDALDSWSQEIAARLKWLAGQKIAIYFMHGNRDFLVGNHFARCADMTILPEPAIFQSGSNKILLVHGDRYCTSDKSHQWFRWLTRNRWFTTFFLRIPLKIRAGMVSKIRQRSQSNTGKTYSQMNIVLKTMLEHMQDQKVTTLIHGHIHKPGLTRHFYNNAVFSQYVLGDWDDTPKVLCYYETNRLEFIPIDLLEEKNYGWP